MKVGRNAPCPCGSGRKFKRCCADKVDSSRGRLSPGEWEFPDQEEYPAEAEVEDDDIAGVVHALAALVAAGGPGVLTPGTREFLAENFDLLIHFLDGFIAATNEFFDEFDEAIVDGYEYLLQVQLLHLGICVEDNYDWAHQVFDSFERRLIGAIGTGEASGRAILAISKAMFEAKLQPSRELVAATEELLKQETMEVRAGFDPAALGAEISHQCGGDPFAIHATMFSASHLGTAAFRANTVRALLEDPQAPMHEAAALAVLDPDPDVGGGAPPARF
jgi:hypothetical protein